MIKKTGYCDYMNQEWVEKYNGLTYLDDKYWTKIEGNTFYIFTLVIPDTTPLSFKGKIYNKIFGVDKEKCYRTLCSIPMIKTQEETIRDVLRSWNFNCKYKWLDEGLIMEEK